MNFSASASRLDTFLLSSLCALSICGCGVGAGGVNAPISAVSAPSAVGALSGVVHGGQFAIYNSTIKLYAAGTTGYGTGATLLASTTTDVNGGFSFSKQGNGAVTSFALTAGGSGYTAPISVAITGGGGTGATATATVSGGVITGITLTANGSGYSSAPSVVISGGTGTGATATASLVTTSASSWSCPSTDPTPDPQIYLTSIGGNTQGTGVTATNNSAAGLMVALGPCSTITSSTQVLMNELTTVATVFALAQYINPGSVAGAEVIGTDAANLPANTGTSATVANAIGYQGAIGLNNAVAGVANLASIANGSAVTSNSYTGTNTTVKTVTVTATPETSKLITIANILAACINTTSSSSNPCNDLFTNASPPPAASVTSQPFATFAAAADTIQAAYYMAVNPIDAGTFTTCTTNSNATTKMGCLFGLATASSPFQPGLGTSPTDWTIGVSFSAYSPTGGTLVLASSGSSTIATQNCANGHSFLFGPEAGAVDAYGNYWFINGVAHTDNLAAISPIGVPIFCGQVLLPSYPYSSGITIDTAGNVWANSTGPGNTTAAQIYELPAPGAVPTATALTSYASTQLGSGEVTTSGIVADGYGNVFYSTFSSSTGISVYEIPSGTATNATTASFLVGSNTSAIGNTPHPAVDSVGRIYFGINTQNDDVELTPPSAAITGYSISSGNIIFTNSGTNTFAVNQKVIVSGLTSTDGLSLDRQQLTLTAVTGTSFTAATALTPTTTVADTGVAVVVPVAPTTAVTTTPYTTIANAFNTGTYGAAVDSNNFFYAGGSCCTPAPNQSLLKAAINPSGTAIVASPRTAYTFSATEIGGNTGTRAIALDGAGNIWFGNEFASSDGGGTESTTTTTNIYSIGEAAAVGGGNTATFTALSLPPTGLVGTDTCSAGTAGCPIGGGFQKAGLGQTYSIAIDPSGNVWAPNLTTAAYGITNGGGQGDANIVLIVGAAVPTVTPLANAAQNGTLATKP